MANCECHNQMVIFQAKSHFEECDRSDPRPLLLAPPKTMAGNWRPWDLVGSVLVELQPWAVGENLYGCV